MRIVSLLPSATEIVCALGLKDELVGISHECDYPPEVLTVPKLTNSTIDPAFDDSKIDSCVTKSLAENGTLYTIDENLLHDLKPDVIFTQKLCQVCTVPFQTIESSSRKIATELGVKYPMLVSLDPNSLNEVYESIDKVGKVTGRERDAKELVIRMQIRAEYIKAKTSKFSKKKKILFLEWVSPPYCAGHWIPDLIDIAGGVDRLAKKHLPSARISWKDIVEYMPEAIVIAACGFNLDRVISESKMLFNLPYVDEIPAFVNEEIYAVDGNSYFNRPGPRIIDSLEILAQILYPEVFYFGYDMTNYRKLEFQGEYAV